MGVDLDTETDYIIKLKDFEREKSESNGSNNSEMARSVDPLKWFGILVPEHLRNSQRTFSKGLEVLLSSYIPFVDLMVF